VAGLLNPALFAVRPTRAVGLIPARSQTAHLMAQLPLASLPNC
jgi:hypothetical protein